MATSQYLCFDTLSLHAGQQPDPMTGARATPVHQTAAFVFRDTDQAAALCNGERAGHVHSRLSNPTNAVLEERLAALEGGVGAVCTASGQAALHLAIVTLLGAGSHIVAARPLAGDAHHLLAHTLPRFGIHTTLVNPRDHEAVRRAIRSETRLMFGELLSNPTIDVLDIPVIAGIAHEAGLPFLVDATLATPYLCRPFEHGADLVCHAATQFLGGHGVAVGGILVDGGRFDWETAGRFPALTAPDPGFHGLDFTEEYGPAAFIMRARQEGLRDFGACLSPGAAFQLLQGVETLSLRMARHVENARKIAAFLTTAAAVAWVNYPELPSHPDHALAKRLLPKGCGAVLSLGVKGGRQAGQRFIESLRLFSHLVDVGDAKSLVIHPASTTHQLMDAQALQAAGIAEDMIRLTVGLEDPDDLLEDLDRALRASQKP